jgi:four helix bundle protein
VYKATSHFPKEEIYGITSQLRRSCASIATNIAEGSGRSGDAEFSRYVNYAIGSASETEYHIILAHDLGYLDDQNYTRFTKDLTELKQMLISLYKKLKA